MIDCAAHFAVAGFLAAIFIGTAWLAHHFSSLSFDRACIFLLAAIVYAHRISK
jgi:hypothetical protein